MKLEISERVLFIQLFIYVFIYLFFFLFTETTKAPILHCKTKSFYIVKSYQAAIASCNFSSNFG